MRKIHLKRSAHELAWGVYSVHQKLFRDLELCLLRYSASSRLLRS